MKKQFLFIYLLVFASTHFLSAQNSDFNNTTINYTDTLVINLINNNKILIIGESLKSIVKYTQADSIKNVFLNQIEMAWANNTLPINAQDIYFFIAPNGNTKLLANQNELNINNEIVNLQLNLPKYHYKILDLKNNYQINFYLEEAALLKNTLTNIKLSEAIDYTHSNAKKEFNKVYKIELNTKNGYEIGDKTRDRKDNLEISGLFGAGILGNTIAPVTGIDMMLGLTNKYAIHKIKAGLGYQVFPFVTSNANEVKNVSLVNSVVLKGLINLNHNSNKNPYWLGAQVGFIKSADINSYNNAFKMGFLYQNKTFNYSFDFIKDANKNWIYGLTIYFPF